MKSGRLDASETFLAGCRVHCTGHPTPDSRLRPRHPTPELKPILAGWSRLPADAAQWRKSRKAGQPGHRHLIFSILRPCRQRPFLSWHGRPEGCRVGSRSPVRRLPAANSGLRGDCSPLAPQLFYPMVGKTLGTSKLAASVSTPLPLPVRLPLLHLPPCLGCLLPGLDPSEPQFRPPEFLRQFAVFVLKKPNPLIAVPNRLQQRAAFG